jgi:hypothetical protein
VRGAASWPRESEQRESRGYDFRDRDDRGTTEFYAAAQGFSAIINAILLFLSLYIPCPAPYYVHAAIVNDFISAAIIPDLLARY